MDSAVGLAFGHLYMLLKAINGTFVALHTARSDAQAGGIGKYHRSVLVLAKFLQASLRKQLNFLTVAACLT
jgi:hypothetical protein